jgi:hypothetical protein
VPPTTALEAELERTQQGIPAGAALEHSLAY